MFHDPITQRFVFVILGMCFIYGWLSGSQQGTDTRSSAQRRAMREDCRSKGL